MSSQKKNTYQLERPVCNPWAECCCNKTLSFWFWNLHPEIKGNLNKPHIFTLFFIFLFSCWVSMLVREWCMGFLLFYLGYGYGKHKNYQKKLCLCSSMVVWFLEFNLTKEAKTIKRMIWEKIKMKAYEGLKLWSLLFDLNGFTHELIDTQTSNILLITWCQGVLKFPIIGPNS